MNIVNDKSKYKVYEEEKVILYNAHYSGYFLCLYPDGFKIEKKVFVPSFILNHDTIYKMCDRVEFDKLANFNYPGYEKVYLLNGIKKDIYVHPNGMVKTHINMEDTINGVHIIKSEDLDEYLKYKDYYKERNEFTI